MPITTLREALADWTDEDVARFALAQCLGIFEPHVDWFDVKHTLFTNDPVSEGLTAIFDKLVELGILETTQDWLQLRWNGHYIGDWESDARSTNS
jgi:hypothetical protein